MNKRIVLIGYSGHSYGCVEVAIKQGFSIVGYYDVLEKISNPYNLKYLGTQFGVRGHAHLPSGLVRFVHDWCCRLAWHLDDTILRTRVKRP